MIYMGLEIGLDVLEKFWKFIGKNVWEPCHTLDDCFSRNNYSDIAQPFVQNYGLVMSHHFSQFCGSRF